MKKSIFYLILALPILFSACNNDDGYSSNQWLSIATVENPDNHTVFHFVRDDSVRLWTAASAYPNYRPKEGQRIIVNYTILNDKPAGSEYNHDVRLNDVYEILTKGIFDITPETQDSIGNDPLRVTDMWIGSNYLNVEFTFLGFDKIHFINLVADAEKTYDDGKIHLEFRHNANKDYATYRRNGIVSFDLRSLQSLTTESSVGIVIHTNEFNFPEGKTYSLTYKFGSAEASPSPERRAVSALNDLTDVE